MNHGRLPWLRPEDLDDEQRQLYDAIVNSPRSTNRGRAPLIDEQGRLHGPFNAMLITPKLGNAVQELGAAVRYGTDLSARAREIAILEVARAKRSNYEWMAHEQAARSAGLLDEEIEAIKTGGDVATLSLEESMVRSVVRSILATRDISDDLLRAAQSQLGQATVMQVIVLVGYYELLSMVLGIWQTPLPSGFEPTFAEEKSMRDANGDQ